MGRIARKGATVTKRKTAEQKQLEENSYLLRQWKRWHREQLEEALAGPHGIMLGELFRMFENLKHIQPAQLIGFARSINWSVIDYDTKLVVLHELNTAIGSFRQKHGLPEIDDGLPNEPDTPFRTIRAIVLTASPHRAPTEA
jgi:hypothetical protein